MANAAPVAEASGQGEKGKGKGRQNQNKKKEVGASEKPAVEASKAPLQDAEATLKQNNNVQKSAAEVQNENAYVVVVEKKLKAIRKKKTRLHQTEKAVKDGQKKINKDQEELLKQKDVIEKEERDLSEIAGQFQKLAKSEAKNQQKKKQQDVREALEILFTLYFAGCGDDSSSQAVKVVRDSIFPDGKDARGSVEASVSHAVKYLGQSKEAISGTTYDNARKHVNGEVSRAVEKHNAGEGGGKNRRNRKKPTEGKDEAAEEAPVQQPQQSEIATVNDVPKSEVADNDKEAAVVAEKGVEVATIAFEIGEAQSNGVSEKAEGVRGRGGRGRGGRGRGGRGRGNRRGRGDGRGRAGKAPAVEGAAPDGVKTESGIGHQSNAAVSNNKNNKGRGRGQGKRNSSQKQSAASDTSTSTVTVKE